MKRFDKIRLGSWLEPWLARLTLGFCMLFATLSSHAQMFTVTPDPVDFGDVPLGEARTLTLVVNPLPWWNGNLVFQSVDTAQLNGTPFAFLAFYHCGGVTLTTHDPCWITVQFAPTTVGLSTEAISLTNYPNTQTFPIQGTGVANLSPDSSSLDFGNVDVGQSADQTVTVTNTSTIVVTLGAPVLPAPFSLVSNSCPATLAANASCTMTVRYTPTAAGQSTGSLSLPITAPAQDPLLIALWGTGVPPHLTPDPAVLDFSHVLLPLSATSSTSKQRIRLYNNSGGTVHTGALDVSNLLGSPFQDVEDGCSNQSIPNTAAAGNNYCDILVRFKPTTLGLSTRTLSLPIVAAPGSQTTVYTHAITLQGTGVVAPFSLSTNALDFGNVLLGQSANLSVTVSNAGAAAVTFGSDLRTPPAGSPFSIASDDCSAAPLAASASCTVTVHYAPTAAGAATADLFLISTPNGIQWITLRGAGVSATASVPALNLYPLLALAALLFALGCWQSGLRKR
jgi:hypothetical protein